MMAFSGVVVPAFHEYVGWERSGSFCSSFIVSREYFAIQEQCESQAISDYPMTGRIYGRNGGHAIWRLALLTSEGRFLRPALSGVVWFFSWVKEEMVHFLFNVSEQAEESLSLISYLKCCRASDLWPLT